MGDMEEFEAQQTDESKDVIGGARVVRATDPDTYSDPDSARVRARQLGCIGIRRYMNRNGGQSWMPCTNESDYRKYSGQGYSGRKYRRQQFDRDVRESIGRNYGRAFREKSANYTKPELRERLKQRIMSGSKGGRPGQWSARKAQLLAIAYRKAGGGYKGGKSKKQRSLVRWGKEKWRTSDGKPAIRGSVTRRYLPAKAWSRLTPSQRAATNRKKIAGSKKGRQFVANTDAAASARKRISRGVKHIEFYDELEVKAIGRRVGGTIGRALAPGDGGGSRRGRAARRGRAIGGRARVVPYDPNPVDADADLQVQEGTIFERTITPQQSLASRMGRGAIQMPRTARPESRAPRKITRGQAKPAPKIVRERKPRETVGVDRLRPLQTPVRREIQRRPTVADEATPEIQPEQSTRDEFLRQFEGDFVTELTRAEKAKIYRDVFDSGVSVQSVADKYDVVKDEIDEVIKEHKKYRAGAFNRFKQQSPKLASAINSRFSSSKNAVQDLIRDGLVSDWDGLLNYALRSTGERATKENITRDLFNTFSKGKDPDGRGRLVLGYRKTNRKGSSGMVRDIASLDSMPDGFAVAGEYRRVAPTIDSRATSARDTNERASRARQFRQYQRNADSMNMWSTSVTGRMSSGPQMTPAEENEWRTREWKRQQLKKLAISQDAKRKGITSLDNVLGIQNGADLATAIQGIDRLDNDTLESTWNDTVLQMQQNGMRIPAYRSNDAPLTPRELAMVANAKRPLVSAFLDEVKKLNPNGNFAKIDVDSLGDKDIEDLFNTFILPELTNPDAPSIQDAQIAAGLPKSMEMVSLADSVAWVMPSGFADLEIRTLLAREQLKSSGMNPDDPAFDEALQQLIDKDYEEAVNDIERWLENGAPEVQTGRGGGSGRPLPPINPNTGEPFNRESWEEAVNKVREDYEREVEQAQARAAELMEALYNIGLEQGWIDNDGQPGGMEDDDESWRTDGDDGQTGEIAPPLGDEFGYPDTDEAWNTPFIDENGNEIPYDGSETHPLNVNPETNQPYDVSSDNLMDSDLYRSFLDPNNGHIREWMDLDNTHTVGRYTKPPAELAARFYDGDVSDSDPEKIDKRIDWDRLITYIEKVAPHFFKRDKKGEMVADIAQISRTGDYSGASFNPAPDPDADPSGYQFRQQMKEFVEAKIKEEAQAVIASDQTAKARRAALWKLLETDTLTPEEIAFDERFFDVQNVEAALALYALENNISKTKHTSLLRVARAAAPSRVDAYDKKRVERIAQDFQNQGKTARQALVEIDRAIEHQIELRTKVGLEYDQFRREYMALTNMITSLLMMRPPNREQTYNRDGSVRQRGWDRKKESASRYLNRIARWDREFIGHVDSNGQWRPGVVSQLVRRLRENEIMTGAVGGGGATSDILQTANQNIDRLREMRSMIEDARGEAKRFGVSGFMRGGGANGRLIGRAEESARRSARKAASGHTNFASPQNLKRYDDFGLPISRATRTSASGFNKRISNLINEATRGNTFKWSESKYFNALPERLKDVVRGLDSTPYSFSTRGFGARFPNRNSRMGRNSVPQIPSREDYEAFELIKGNKFFKRGNPVSERRSVSGAMRLNVDKIGDFWYPTDRNGDIVLDIPFEDYDEALNYINRVQIDFEDKPEFQFNDLVRFNAYKKRIDTYPYHGEARIREIAEQMQTVWVESEARKEKKVAADSVIVRVNPETGEREVAMIRREFPPFSSNREANLPGGFVDASDLPDGQTEIDEKVFIATAKREKLEEVGVKEEDIIRTEFIGEIDEPDWDPRFPNGMRVGGVFFEVKPNTQLKSGDDARDAFWVPISELAGGKLGIGFGHAGFIAAMLWDDEPELADKMSTVSALARRRNQRIIREVNRKRVLKNQGRPNSEQVPLFPRDLPNPDQGYEPRGPVAEERARATYRRLTGRMAGVPSGDVELTDEIRYALTNYTGDGFGLLNQILRETNGLVLDRDLVKDRESLRAAVTTNDPSSLATRIAMGTDASYERLMKELDIYRDMNDWLKAGTVKPGTVLYRTLGLWKGIEDLKEGDEFYDGSFQSTTSNLDQGFLTGPRNLRIFVGEGVSGRALSEGIDAPRFSEDEVILPAGARYRVLRAPDGKQRKRGDIAESYWDVEIVSQGVSGAMKGKNNFPWNINEQSGRAENGNSSANNLSAAIKRSVSGKMAMPRKQFVGRDFYGDLDLQPTATLKEIKNAYREIAKVFHPDKNPDNKVAAEKFRKATEAYEVLSDARERDYYDSTILPNISRDATRAATTQSGASQPPRRPAWMDDNPRPAPQKQLPKLKNVLASRLGINIPIKDNIIPGPSSLTRYTRSINEPGIDVQSPDYGTIKIDEDRFWDVHYSIAKAINDSVTKKRPTGKPKRYIIIGGPPASGKTSLRLDKSLDIPSFDEAVHVDADEIKELIPEARKAHALNNPQWASVVHDESRMIVNTTLRMGLERENDIVHDSLGQFREGFGALKAARKAGYDVVAHYVVANPSVIKERLAAREKTDPRVIPRHIVDATIENNKRAMVEVADFADEFYLYDGSSNSKKLIARKTKGGELEILDEAAYEFGFFERIQDPDSENEYKYFERPDTSGRTDTVAKNSWMADIIRDFDKGAKVSDLAKKYKVTNRTVWDAVTKYSVDENRTEAPRPQNNNRTYWQGVQGSFDFDEGYGPGYDLNSDEDPNLFINLVADTADAGLEDDLLTYVSLWRGYAPAAIVDRLKDMGWTDESLNLARSRAPFLGLVFERRPNASRQETFNMAQSWLNALEKEDKKALLRLIDNLATDAKRGTFAPTIEFIGLAQEFGVPFWVIDHEYEDRFKRGGGATGRMAGKGSQTQFVEPRPNIPKKELTADDVKVIKYPDSDVPALKLEPIEEIVSMIHPDNPKKSKNPDLQNDDYSFVDYLKGVQYPTEQQIEAINKFIAEQKKSRKRLTTNWKLTASNGSELEYGQQLPDDIDSFDVKTSDGVFLFRVKKLKNLDEFNERHVVTPMKFAQQVTPESLLQEVFELMTYRNKPEDKDIDMLDNSMFVNGSVQKFDPPFAHPNQAKILALRSGYDPESKFERDNFSGVELEFGSSEEANFVKSNIQRYQQAIKLNTDFTFEFYEHLSDLREKMGLSREDKKGSGMVHNSKNDRIFGTRNEIHGPNVKEPYSIDSYSFNYNGTDVFLTPHEMMHIAGGQGFDRHGDHTANRMAKFIFPNHWHIMFNHVSRIQNFTKTLDRIPMWVIIPETMMNMPGE